MYIAGRMKSILFLILFFPLVCFGGEVDVKYSGMLIKSSPCGHRYFASLTIENKTDGLISVNGRRVGQKFFLDNAFEAQLEYRLDTSLEWSREPVLEERRQPNDVLEVPPNGQEQVYVQWDIGLLYWYPADTRYRYVVYFGATSSTTSDFIPQEYKNKNEYDRSGDGVCPLG